MEEKEIRLIRLTSGEEILATIHSKNKNYTTVIKPVLLIPNKERIGFMPYLSYSDIDIHGLEIKEEHIMFNVQPTDELENNYYQMTSAVVTPPKQKIVT